MKNPFKALQPKPLLTVGGKTEETRYDRVLPGLRKWDDAADFYFQDRGEGECFDQYHFLLNTPGNKLPNVGSLGGLNCLLTTPDGLRFFAVQAFKSPKEIRKAINFGAAHYGLLTADVEGDRFTLSDGRFYPTKSCEVEFWGPDDLLRNPLKT